MKNYCAYTVYLSMSQILLIFLGVFVGKSHGLICTGDGYQWIYHSLTGEGFILLVMLNMIFQCFLIENVLYDVP